MLPPYLHSLSYTVAGACDVVCILDDVLCSMEDVDYCWEDVVCEFVVWVYNGRIKNVVIVICGISWEDVTLAVKISQMVG